MRSISDDGSVRERTFVGRLASRGFTKITNVAEMRHDERILIVGAGLIGTLLSVFLARHGYQVEVYEKTADPRVIRPLRRRSSVNLTLSDRGLRPLDATGVGEHVRANAMPVYGRIIHTNDGNRTFQPYGVKGEALYSITRNTLHAILLDFAERGFPIQFHFGEKCVGLDLENYGAWLQHVHSDDARLEPARVIFGADGAFSAVRFQLQKVGAFESCRTYLPLAYKELSVPAATVGEDWLLENQALHLWPRGEYMLIGFPNIDGSFTLSLHMPLEGEVSSGSIRTGLDVLELFRRSFPDAVPYIPRLIEQFFGSPQNTIVTIRCEPWVFQNRVALIGDAAHPIVPYLGQGANAGFEDCAVLSELIDKYGGHWPAVLASYDGLRRPDLDAVAHLATKHFGELSELVDDARFLLRKQIERALNLINPDRFTSLYNMIAFSSMSYGDAIELSKKQEPLIDEILADVRVEVTRDDQEMAAMVARILDEKGIQIPDPRKLLRT